MKNILKKYGLSFFAVVALLFVQAYCDLALPDYTSKIITIKAKNPQNIIFCFYIPIESYPQSMQ